MASILHSLLNGSGMIATCETPSEVRNDDRHRSGEQVSQMNEESLLGKSGGGAMASGECSED